MSTPSRGAGCRRVSLEGAREERLFFAQVREDARLEVEALRPHALKRYAVVSSGGCTALSLLARGAGSVAAVDSNRAQNHLVELKVAALAGLEHRTALGFLGAVAADARARREAYVEIRPALSPAARAYWDRNRRAVETGVLGAGVTEKFLRTVIAALRLSSIREPAWRDCWPVPASRSRTASTTGSGTPGAGGSSSH